MIYTIAMTLILFGCVHNKPEPCRWECFGPSIPQDCFCTNEEGFVVPKDKADPKPTTTR